MSARVFCHLAWACVLLGAVLVASPDAGAAAQAPGANSARELERWLARSRSEFLRRIDRIPAGRGDRARRQDFRENLLEFRDQLVGLWVMRFAPLTEEWAREDLEDRSKDFGDTLERMRKYVDRDSDPPEVVPAEFDGATLAEKLDLLIMVGLRLRNTVVEVTDGAVLDIGLLSQVRADFATLEDWVGRLRDLARE